MYSTQQKRKAANVVRVVLSGNDRVGNSPSYNPTFRIDSLSQYFSNFDLDKPVYVAVESFTHRTYQNDVTNGTSYYTQLDGQSATFNTTLTGYSTSNYVNTTNATGFNTDTISTKYVNTYALLWVNMPSVGTIYGSSVALNNCIFTWRSGDSVQSRYITSDTVGIPVNLQSLCANNSWEFKIVYDFGETPYSPFETIGYMFTLAFWQRPDDVALPSHY